MAFLEFGRIEVMCRRYEFPARRCGFPRRRGGSVTYTVNSLPCRMPLDEAQVRTGTKPGLIKRALDADCKADRTSNLLQCFRSFGVQQDFQERIFIKSLDISFQIDQSLHDLPCAYASM